MNFRLKAVLVLSVVCSISASDWSYGDPDDWSHVNPQCGGKVQSPINIERLSFVLAKRASPLKLKNGDKIPNAVTYSNDGHGFALSYTYDDEVKPTISGGPLGRKVYNFVNLHVHWKSEHTIDSEQYDAEMHVVFFNSKYASFEKAMSHADGLAVLALLYEIPTTSLVPKSTRPFMKVTSKIRDSGTSFKQTKNLTPFTLNTILDGEEKFKVWSYKGSLTTPSCNEIVTWMVVKKPITINPSEIAFLKKMKNDHGEKLLKTNRPVQALNGRIIYSYGN